MTWSFIGISPFNSEPDEAPTPVFEVPDYVPSPALKFLLVRLKQILLNLLHLGLGHNL